jgi:hypothetical protein
VEKAEEGVVMIKGYIITMLIRLSLIPAKILSEKTKNKLDDKIVAILEFFFKKK